MRARRLGPFVLLVAAWLFVTFALWWLATPLLEWPVTLLSRIVTQTAFAGLVHGVEQDDNLITFVTTLAPVDAAATGTGKAVLEVPSNYRLFSFGLPMLAALILAAGQPNPARRLAIGYAALLPFQTFSVVADFLKNISVEAASQAGFAAWQLELIAFSYQFGTLILPTVAPAIVWVLMHGRFLESFAGKADQAGKENRAT